MNPNKAGLVVAALATQWALTQAPVPLVGANARSRVEPGHSTPTPPSGAAARSEGSRPAPVASLIGPLALKR